MTPEEIAEIVLEFLPRPDAGPKNFRKQLEKIESRKGKWGFHLDRPFSRPYTSLPAKKIFLSEFDIKQLLRNGKKELRIPGSAIISPLAEEWLDEKRIKIIRG